MLYRKIASLIEAHLQSGSNKILLIDGARQVGKTYIVRYVGQKLFENYIEINLVEDALGAGLFANVRTVEDFYLQVSMLAGDRMKEKENTLIFLDEIQAYPHLLTMLKFLAQDGRFTYIASGSLLGVTLAQTPSIPMGSIRKVQMFPLDFEEFLYANGLNEFAITAMRRRFEALEALDEATHNKVMDLFRKYLLVGGLPDAVNTYLAEKNIQTVREIQREIHDYYAADASKYGEERKLMIRRIYDLIPSNMENKKKRVVAKSIEDKKGKTFRDYSDEFEYLISAGIALPVQAISNPVFPLIESAGKNLLKLYLNDVGLEITSWLCIVGAAPFAALGFIRYQGMNAEQILVAAIKSVILSHRKLDYQPVNIYYQILKPVFEKNIKEDSARYDKKLRKIKKERKRENKNS